MKEVRLVVQLDNGHQVEELTRWMDRVTDEIGAHAWGYHVHDADHPHQVVAWRVMDSRTETAMTDPISEQEAAEFYAALPATDADFAYLEPLYAPMSATDVQTKRREAFAKLIERHGQHPTDYDEGEEEDPRPYLDGELSVLPWALVTVNYTSHGEAKHFFLLFDAIGEAMERGVLFANDGIFEELPVEIVNLDTGASFEPDYSFLPWKKVA